MKKKIILLISITTLAFSLNWGSLLNTTQDSLSKTKTSTTNTKTTLTNSTIASGLKEALNAGVDYAIRELGKDNGYINNSLVKIPLPENLAKAEGIIRKVGGDNIADDLINSMNKAASNAAPKTLQIFTKAISDINIEDAKKILLGDDKAATNYFQTNTSDSLKKIITPIVKESMKENNVAKYYEIFNDTYKTYGKGLVENTAVMGYAKSIGIDSFLPGSSDEKLDDYVTNKAINGLFKMIAQKEMDIRKNPIAQSTSLLKKVFGN